MRTVLLIGTNHYYQYPGNKGEKEFRVLVKTTCQEQGIKVIAEEMSLEALSKNGAQISIGKQVADSLSIPHLYCDPSSEEQKKLGIKQPGRTGDPEADAIRERYWLAHILPLETWPVLFICGATHTESFRDLLQANDIVVHVVCESWRRPEDWWLGRP
jgi:hypothetical protein